MLSSTMFDSKDISWYDLLLGFIFIAILAILASLFL